MTPTYRAKKYPQDTILVPRTGIQLLKKDIVYDPVGVSEFRNAEIPFDIIIRVVNSMTRYHPLEERNRIQACWDQDRENLERTFRGRHLAGRMDIEAFPKQVEHELPSDTVMEPLDDALKGNICDEVLDEGDIDEVRVGTDCVAYTHSKLDRPWTGRVVELLPNNEVTIHWYTRKKGRKGVFEASSNPDGSPSCGAISLDTLMLWDMTEQKTENSFFLSNYWTEIIKAEYEDLDRREQL